MTPRFQRIVDFIVSMTNYECSMNSHVSFLWNGGTILSYGKSIPLTQYSMWPSIHAEHDCLRKFNFKNRTKKRKRRAFLLFVLRLDREGNWKNSKPCQHCLKLLKQYRISKVIYSRDDGTFFGEFVNYMNQNDCIISQGFKLRRHVNSSTQGKTSASKEM